MIWKSPASPDKIQGCSARVIAQGSPQKNNLMKTRRDFLRTIQQAALVSGAGPALLSTFTAGCSEEPPVEATPDPRQMARTAWYRQAKFGLFLHWGAYSVAGVEASWPIMKPDWFPHSRPISESEYVALASRFNPVRFDPEAWVRQARQAGMRYMVFTTKHHDGFCMFDAPGTDYKITNTPYGKDVLALLAAACEKEKMPLGFYYSPPDMHHPGYRDTSKPATENWNGEPSRPGWAGYLDYMESHLRTLLTNYGKVAIVWFDGLFGQDKYDPPRFHRLIHELSPDTLINDRLGPECDFVTPEQFFPDGIPVKRKGPRPEVSPEMIDAWMKMSKLLPRDKLIALAQEFAKKQYPTKPLPAPGEFQLWETCMTMNDSWAYNPSDTNYKTPEKLIRTLVEVASRGGNFLLNVGPSPEGVFPLAAVERLRRIGQWMQTNGESIHGTTYGPLQGLKFGRTTAKDGTVFLHVFDWPGDKLQVEGIPGKVASVALLGGEGKLQFAQSEGRLGVNLPAAPPDPIASVLAIGTAPAGVA